MRLEISTDVEICQIHCDSGIINENIEGSRCQITDGAGCLAARGPKTTDNSYSETVWGALSHVNIDIL